MTDACKHWVLNQLNRVFRVILTDGQPRRLMPFPRSFDVLVLYIIDALSVALRPQTFEHLLLTIKSIIRSYACRSVLMLPQGELGDTFFILKEGRAVVTQNSNEPNGRGKQLRHMEEYSCFGERALLTAEPRSANVVAETKVSKSGQCCCRTHFRSS